VESWTIVATAKAERLLNLVIALLNTRQFRTAQWIHEKVAGYGDAPTADAFNRMFERDKQELREMGIPLLTDDRDGYRIPQVEFSLPELNFTPAETAALGLAARLWSTTALETAGAGAVRKIRDATGTTSGRTGQRDQLQRRLDRGGSKAEHTTKGCVGQPRVETRRHSSRCYASVKTEDGRPAVRSPGLREGDVLVAFKGEPIASIDQLQRRLVAAEIGVASPITVIRHIEKLEVFVTPEEWEPSVGRN